MAEQDVRLLQQQRQQLLAALETNARLLRAMGVEVDAAPKLTLAHLKDPVQCSDVARAFNRFKDENTPRKLSHSVLGP